MEITETRSMPYYNSDYKNNKIIIKGISINNDVRDFYISIQNDLKLNLPNIKNDFKIEVDLVYFNSKSSKYLMEIFNIFKDIVLKNGYKVIVDWYYEDDDLDMKETAFDYEYISELKFNTIPKNSNNINKYTNF